MNIPWQGCVLLIDNNGTIIALPNNGKTNWDLDELNETDYNQSILVNISGINISLTERELKIVSLIVDGNDNKEIGVFLFIAEGTVKNIITEIISKLQLKDRTQLAVYAVKNGLV